MPEVQSQNQTPKSTSQEDGFTTKSVSDNMLDAETKNRIGTTQPTPASLPTSTGEPGFFAKNKLYVLIAATGFILLIAVFFFIFRAKPTPKEANIRLDIQAADELPANTGSVVKIVITNQDKSTLTGTELELVYPEGMKYLDSTPKSNSISGNTFTIGDIPAGQGPTLFIKLQPQGSVGDSQTIVAKLRYHYSNFNSEFIKQVEKKYTLLASGVALDLTGPSTTNNAQVINYRLTYVNNSEFTFKNARIQFTYPPGFSYGQGSPDPSVGKNIWNLPEVPAGYTGTITVSGSFASATPGESQTIVAEFQSADQDGTFRKQSSASYITQIQSQPLLAALSLSENTDRTVVDPGDRLAYTVHYQNNATVAARGVNVVVTLSSKAIDTKTIQAEGAQISGNIITWNASSISNLEVVNPNEGGDLQFNFELKNPPVRDSSTNVDVKASVKIKSNEYDSYLPGNDITLKVSSIASLYTGLDFGSGELPPKVGQDSFYRVSLGMKNLTNTFNNCTVTAFLALPPNSFDKTSLVPSLEASRTTFDTQTGKITWNVGQLKAHTGDLSQPRTLSFMVRVNPSASQVGNVVTLVKNISATCTDSFTDKTINLQAQDVQTDQLPDDNASSEGRVVQ